MKKSHITLLAFFALLFIAPLGAQDPLPLGTPDPTDGQPNVVVEMGVLAGFALLPFAVMLLTSFLKIVIVLSLLRNALGVNNSPPNQAIIGMALLMTIYVMFPTGYAMYKAGQEYAEDVPTELFSSQTAIYVVEVADRAKEPLRVFLKKHLPPTPKVLLSTRPEELSPRVQRAPLRQRLHRAHSLVYDLSDQSGL